MFTSARALSWVAFARSMGNLIGPVLGGILADPSTLYPAIFPSNSLWGSYKYLLPNLTVALLQLLTLVAVFLFLKETHPKLSAMPDPGMRLWNTIWTVLRWKTTKTTDGCYSPLNTDEANLEQRSPTVPPEETEHELQNLDDVMTATDNQKESVPGSSFTHQVILQILSVSLLAFHKVSSDAIMPTFLAAPSETETENTRGFQESGGFNYSGQKIGFILLSQAIFALCIQVTIVPLFVNRFGTLNAYRIVLGIYPFAYVFTPFLPRLGEPLALGIVALDLWEKVALSSVGYICSAVLISDTTPAKEFLARVNGASASTSCLARSIGPLVTGKLFAIGLEIGYVGIAFWILSAIAFLDAVGSWFLRDHV
ncbi:hypothetical protein NPX13_g2774 [Xylaria arbuscula]|uniref:Major facilitator superfamily (MFS) profile domain-containing protein n=1 Tax=Xylaria arbuscula TaxID=114810 RepID=A0A9W8TNF7_9PEZI|nr:hypothetical protein NPX13_g2774 [Xylaria arbuscula]